MKAEGIIQRKKVDSTQWGNRVSFMLGNKWYSCFDKNIGDTHTREMLHGLVEGDEVEFEVVEKPNKNRPGEVFYNIVGAVRVERIDKETGAKNPPKDTGGDERTRSMALAYAKDLCVAGKIELGDIYSQADYFIAYIKGKKREDEEPF